MPVVLNLDGQHPKCRVPNDTWRIWIDSKGREDASDYWDLSYQPGPLRWLELAKLKELSELSYSGLDSTVVDYVCSEKCSLTNFTWHENDQARFDFSAAPCLQNLGLEIDRSKVSLKLPTHGQFDYLRLLRPPKSFKASVACPDKGSGVTLMIYHGALIAIAGMKQIDSLKLFGARDVDLAVVVRAYPKLRRLCIHGRPVSLLNIDALAKLKQLEALEIHECYSMSASEFPDASQFSKLKSVDFDGLRSDEAKVVKEKFKGVEMLSIRGKRTDQWITTNVDNPFRNWGDDFGATAGKKAMDAWNAARAGIEKPPKSASKTKAKAVLKVFVEVFNKLDERTGMETDQREQIYEEFTALASRLPTSTVTDDDYYKWAEYA